MNKALMLKLGRHGLMILDKLFARVLARFAYLFYIILKLFIHGSILLQASLVTLVVRWYDSVIC